MNLILSTPALHGSALQPSTSELEFLPDLMPGKGPSFASRIQAMSLWRLPMKLKVVLRQERGYLRIGGSLPVRFPDAEPGVLCSQAPQFFTSCLLLRISDRTTIRVLARVVSPFLFLPRSGSRAAKHSPHEQH